MKNKVTNLDIVVQVIGGKPYYSLKYKKLGNNYFNVGYSSYSLENVIAWKNEYFDMIQQDEDDGWIPVDERLPEEDGTYLVTFKNGIKVCMVGYGSCERTVLGHPIGHGWYSLEETQYYVEDSIIAWMPLPEPYKETK